MGDAALARPRPVRSYACHDIVGRMGSV